MTAGTMTGRRRWLAGAPAIVALLGGAGTVAWLYLGSAAARTGWYADAADAALDAQDFRTAAVCYARLNQASPQDVDVAFKWARSLDAIGQVDRARGLLLQLAPPDDPKGYLPAHLRLVRQALAGDRPTPAEMDDAVHHLAPALRVAPADPEANYWAAVLLAARGQWDQVAGPAAAAASLHDVLAPRLAAIAKAQGDPPQSAAWSHAGS